LGNIFLYNHYQKYIEISKKIGKPRLGAVIVASNDLDAARLILLPSLLLIA
jgi:hypothetical protein